MDIKSINWAKPSSRNAELLINLNINELIDSYSYISSICSYKKYSVRDVLQSSFDKVIHNKPVFFLCHAALIIEAEKSNKPGCHMIFDYLYDVISCLKNHTRQPSISRFGKTYSSNLEELLLTIMQRDHQETYNGKYKNNKSCIITPSVDKAYETQSRLLEFFKDLQSIDEQHFSEVSTLIDNITLIQSNGVNASSYLNMLGMFFLRTFEPSKENWSRLAEHVVHESAHNLLYHIWYQEPVITNDEGKYYTPFRLDYRPLSGVYHAMFVLARTIYLFDCLLKNNILKKEDIKSHYNEQNNETPFKDKFQQTVNVINDSGKLTLFGSKLMSDCEGLVKSCEHYI